MGKPTIRICENRDADQLYSNCTADQHFYFCNTDSTIYIIHSSKVSSFQPVYHDCTDRFVSDLIDNPNCWFSHAKAHIHLKVFVVHVN